MSGTGDLHFDAALDLWREGRGPNPRPRRRIVDAAAGRSKCLAAGAECRLCRTRSGLQRHHLVPKGQQGDDLEENLVPLCGDFENGCHRRITENDPTALSALRAALWPEEEAYIVIRRGYAWLESRYGRPPDEA